MFGEERPLPGERGLPTRGKQFKKEDPVRDTDPVGIAPLVLKGAGPWFYVQGETLIVRESLWQRPQGKVVLRATMSGDQFSGRPGARLYLNLIKKVLPPSAVGGPLFVCPAHSLTQLEVERLSARLLDVPGPTTCSRQMLLF